MTEASEPTTGFSAEEQSDAPADDTGLTSAEADLEAGFDSDDDDAEGSRGASGSDAPADSHQADVDAGYDDSDSADDR